MQLPKLENPGKYAGLYVFDFGDQAGVGFTAQEVAELFESEKYKGCKAYKVHKAYPDGRLELTGVDARNFQLEMGMFFYSTDLAKGRGNFDRLVKLAVEKTYLCRAKVHLAKYAEDKFVTAVIYPAEYNDEISGWLLDGGYKTEGPAEGGLEALQRYYDQRPQILDSHQLFGKQKQISRTGAELLEHLKLAVQR